MSELKLKHKYGIWVKEPFVKVNFEIRNEARQNIATIWGTSNEVTTVFPSFEEAKINTDLIEAAPAILEALVILRNQVVDRVGSKENPLIIPIDEILKPFTNEDKP